MRQIAIGTPEWCSLINEIMEVFNPGELISHEWLKSRFGFEKLEISDFDSTEDFICTFQNLQFTYMGAVDALRWQLLEERKVYLKNIRGDGYTLLPAKDQVKYGYDEFLKTVKSASRQADLIMNNVLPVSFEQQARDNNLRARYSMLKQMLTCIKR